MKRTLWAVFCAALLLAASLLAGCGGKEGALDGFVWAIEPRYEFERVEPVLDADPMEEGTACTAPGEAGYYLAKTGSGWAVLDTADGRLALEGAFPHQPYRCGMGHLCGPDAQYSGEQEKEYNAQLAALGSTFRMEVGHGGRSREYFWAPGKEAVYEACMVEGSFLWTALAELSPPVQTLLPVRRGALRADFPYYLVETGLFAALYNKIYRASLLRGLRFDPALRINEDLQFNMQALARCGAVFFDPTPYYLYNDTADGSLSRRLRTDLLEAEVYTRPAVLGFLSACGLNGEEAASLLRRRQGNVAAAQCALLLGRPGKLTFSQYRALFSRALGPAHCRAAVLAWVKQNYSAAPRAFYSACVRLRLAGGLAALCRLRGRSCP